MAAHVPFVVYSGVEVDEGDAGAFAQGEWLSKPTMPEMLKDTGAFDRSQPCAGLIGLTQSPISRTTVLSCTSRVVFGLGQLSPFCVSAAVTVVLTGSLSLSPFASRAMSQSSFAVM